MLKNLLEQLMLDSLGAEVDFLGLATAFPGSAGSNEVAGGSPAYARQAASWSAAAARAVNLSNAPAFDIPASTEVAWVMYWNAVSAGNYRGYAPLGGDAVPKKFNVNTGTDFVTTIDEQGAAAAHGYTDGMKVVFIGAAAPTGLTEGTIYFVRDATTDTFKVAATLGGAAIDLTALGSADCRVSKIVPEVFAAQGVYTLNDLNIAFAGPDAD